MSYDVENSVFVCGGNFSVHMYICLLTTAYTVFWLFVFTWL